MRLCLDCSPPRYTTLHYLIQYHVIEASRVIARMLLQGNVLSASSNSRAAHLLVLRS